MKAQIRITGQISGNFRLKNACMTMDCELSKLMFNGFKLVFRTMKEARQAMKDGYKFLKQEEPDFYHEGGISLYNDQLMYDASMAKLSRYEK